MLTVVLNMFIKHFNAKNTANFSQSFQMINMNNKRAQSVVQNRTQSLQICTVKKSMIAKNSL